MTDKDKLGYKFKKLLKFWKDNPEKRKRSYSVDMDQESPNKKRKAEMNSEAVQIPVRMKGDNQKHRLKIQEIFSHNEKDEMESLQTLARDVKTPSPEIKNSKKGTITEESISPTIKNLSNYTNFEQKPETSNNEQSQASSSKPGEPLDGAIIKSTATIRRNFKRSVIPVPSLIKELLSTEVTYVENLNIVVKVFIQPLKKDSILTQEELNKIFSNIETILNFNACMLVRLEERISNWSVHQCLGDIFLELVPYLKMYSNYISNYKQAIETLQELRNTKPKFRAFLEEALSNPLCNTQALPAFLIQPIQRIPRYKLLLEQLVSKTAVIHPDYNDLSKALGYLSEIAVVLNNKIREHENRQKIIDIQAMFRNKNNDPNSEIFTLVQPHRTLLKQCMVHYIELSNNQFNLARGLLQSSRQPSALFIFNDLVLLANENEHGVKPIALIPIVSLFLKSDLETLYMCFISPENPTQYFQTFSTSDFKTIKTQLEIQFEMLNIEDKEWRNSIKLIQNNRGIWEIEKLHWEEQQENDQEQDSMDWCSTTATPTSLVSFEKPNPDPHNLLNSYHNKKLGFTVKDKISTRFIPTARRSSVSSPKKKVLASQPSKIMEWMNQQGQFGCGESSKPNELEISSLPHVDSRLTLIASPIARKNSLCPPSKANKPKKMKSYEYQHKKKNSFSELEEINQPTPPQAEIVPFHSTNNNNSPENSKETGLDESEVPLKLAARAASRIRVTVGKNTYLCREESSSILNQKEIFVNGFLCTVEEPKQEKRFQFEGEQNKENNLNCNVSKTPSPTMSRKSILLPQSSNFQKRFSQEISKRDLLENTNKMLTLTKSPIETITFNNSPNRLKPKKKVLNSIDILQHTVKMKVKELKDEIEPVDLP